MPMNYTLNIRFTFWLITLAALSGVSRAADPTDGWFAGMLR
jgi:hypothetical protein